MSYDRLSNILTDHTRDEWIAMSHEFFVKHVVENLNMLRKGQLKSVIENLTYPQFEMLTSKCWEEQDQQPLQDSNDDSNDEERFRQAYDETLPIVVLLENILSIRIESEQEHARKETMAKQLALLNIILQPHLFDDVAKKINEKRSDE